MSLMVLSATPRRWRAVTDFISQMILLLAVFLCGFLIGDKRA